MWMKEAVLTREQAKADKENRSVLVERSVEELEEMAYPANHPEHPSNRAGSDSADETAIQ